ncbi:hypothetical protein ACFRH4_49235 [Streptomyces mirabilis]|uniref:hypothetical protein n=1 Tax=Streptomyces mirabilis TaxID=68239 RepID=UPI0036CD7158
MRRGHHLRPHRPGPGGQHRRRHGVGRSGHRPGDVLKTGTRTKKTSTSFGLLLLGHKPVAVAQKMGIDASNARVTLHHARHRLGRILGWIADEVSRVIQLCQVLAAEGRRTVPAA